MKIELHLHTTGFSDCGAGLYVPKSLLEEAQDILSADMAAEE